MSEILRSESYLLKDQLIAWRRDFHRHPELAFRNFGRLASSPGIYLRWGWKCRRVSERRAWWAAGRPRSAGGDAGFDMDALPFRK